MNELKIWEHEEFGSLRTMEIDGEPWFVGKDVAAALGYANPSVAITKKVYDEDKQMIMITQETGFQNGNVSSAPQSKTTLINESGMYSLVLGSKLESAKKFKRWVTSVVLPSIRKTGGYMTDDAATKIANGDVEALNNILIASLQLNKRLTAENQQLLEHNEELQETIDQYDELIGGKGYFYIGRLGKETGIGANKIRKLMAEDKIIYKTKRGWQSYARYDGWFHAKLSSGDWGTTITLMLTPKGYTELLKRYKTKTLVGFAEVQTAIEEENNF